MKTRLIWLCLLMALVVAACDNSNNPKNNNGQKVEEEDSVKSPLDLLSDSIAMDGNRADLYLKRAHLYMEMQQVSAAMTDVNQAIQLDPKNVDAYLLLSDIYFVLSDVANINSSLNKALEVDPHDARPMVKLAELNLLQENYNLCFGYIDNALKISTYNPNAYFVKGMAYMAKQDTASALKNFLIAREQDVLFYAPQREICAIYLAQRNPLTESFMRSMLTNFPDEPIVRYELALFLQDNGQPEEALEHYDTLLMRFPGNSRFLYNKGYVYFVYLQDNEKALDYFNQSLQSAPDYIDALYNKGRVYEKMGNYAQAKTIYAEVLRQSPNYQLAIDGMNRVNGN